MRPGGAVAFPGARPTPRRSSLNGWVCLPGGSPPSSQNKVFPQERWQGGHPAGLMNAEAAALKEGRIVCAP